MFECSVADCCRCNQFGAAAHVMMVMCCCLSPAGTAQPSPAQPSPAQPSPAQLSAALLRSGSSSSVVSPPSSPLPGHRRWNYQHPCVDTLGCHVAHSDQYRQCILYHPFLLLLLLLYCISCNKMYDSRSVGSYDIYCKNPESM